jgi:glycosyltransferase involved in cell wall biosynthesis
VRYAALVHDVLPLTHPQFWPSSNLAVKRAAFATLGRSRATIFTYTEHNARLIRQVLQRDARVVRFGCGQLTDAEADEALENPLPNRESHLLYVGAFEPRKGVIGLIDVFERAVADLDRELSLVLIGQGDPGYVRTLTERIARSPLRDTIRVPSADRQTTLHEMRTANALLLPSIAEGFGLPIVEALAPGTGRERSAGDPVVGKARSSTRLFLGSTGQGASRRHHEHTGADVPARACCGFAAQLRGRMLDFDRVTAPSLTLPTRELRLLPRGAGGRVKLSDASSLGMSCQDAPLRA